MLTELTFLGHYHCSVNRNSRYSQLARKHELSGKPAKRSLWYYACTVSAVAFVRYPKLVALAGTSEVAQNLFDFGIVMLARKTNCLLLWNPLCIGDRTRLSIILRGDALQIEMSHCYNFSFPTP